jgi:NAD(P)-dependent dehydrogenase (short-subunit alcohol dehydrogenase family)
MEWAPKVRVNSVTPGLVRTEDAEAHYGDEQAQQAVAATVPVGRMADPTEIADACLFLASDLSGFTTGANLVLHGGGERPPYLDAVDRG